MPGFPVHPQLLELAQTHVHRVGDLITINTQRVSAATFSGPKELSQNSLTQMVLDPKDSFCAWSFQVLTNKSLFVVFKFGIIFVCFYPLPHVEYIPILDWYLKDTYAAHHL